MIRFFTEDISYEIHQKLKLKNWIKQTISAEGYQLNELNFIFCSDNYLLQINQEYLNHDTYTDIITFNNSESDKLITGDIFISIDRIRENAKKFKVLEIDELHRVMIHGTLHLLGYLDKSKTDKGIMTKMEDWYLFLKS